MVLLSQQHSKEKRHLSCAYYFLVQVSLATLMTDQCGLLHGYIILYHLAYVQFSSKHKCNVKHEHKD